MAASPTWMGQRSRKVRISPTCSEVTWAMTSSSRSACPTAAPAAAAAWIPRSPPVLGTTTLLTFFRIFPLTLTSIRTGILPSRSRAIAAA